MKKILLLIITVLLCSCASNKIELSGTGKLIEVENFDKFQTIESNNKEFAVYVYLPGCTTCAKFKPILDEYIQNKKIDMYSISSTILPSDSSILKTIEYAPSVIIYKDGKPFKYLDANSNSHIKYYETIEGFSEWIEKYTIIK